MISLGIESTAHTLGIGITEGKKILANELAVYKPLFSGIHPRKAAEHSSKEFICVLSNALKKSDINLDEIGLIGFSQGPGLGAPLRIGCVAARFLSLLLKKPIMGVNHCVAHIEISKLFTNMSDPLVVYVSGGNTQIIIKENRYKVIGETLDIGIGNLFDVFARKIGIKYAHGSAIEKMAEKGKYIELPYIVKGMDLSFSGLLTEAEKKIPYEKKEDIAYSLQENSFSMLVEATERALVLTKKNELLVCGGVAQNKRLQKMLEIMCKEHKCRFGVAPNEFNADNGAMIAYTAWLLFKKGKRMGINECVPIQKFRVDEAEI